MNFPLPATGGQPPSAEKVGAVQKYHQSMERLETFLEEILKKDLEKVMRERDALYNSIADCHKLRSVLGDVRRSAQGVAGADDGKDRPQGSSSWVPEAEVTMLTDIGCRFFMQAKLRDPTVVHLNIGCGVVLPMTHDEAVRFLVKKEGLLNEAAGRKTKDALRLRFRIRVVMEAITRLYDAQMAVARQ
jgi:prefoldin subunit 5